MKGLILYPFLFLLILVSCSKDPDPPLPDPIKSYFTLYNFLMVPFEVSWEGDDASFEISHPYGDPILAFTTIDKDSADVTFSMKRSGTGTIIKREVYTLHKDKFYLIALMGTENNPYMLFDQMDLGRPEAGMIKIRIMQAAPDLDPVDLYMGGTGTEFRISSGLSYSDITDYVELSQVLARDSLIVSPQGISPSDSTLMSYAENEVFLPEQIYLGVIAHTNSSPLSSVRLELYDHPVEN